MQPDEQLALDNCSREPVHIPGRIQAFGGLMGFELDSGLVNYHSQNLGSTYLSNESNLLGRSYEDLIPSRSVIHAVRGALSLPTIGTQRDRIGVFELHGQMLDLAVYRTEDTGVLEMEPIVKSRSSAQTSVSIARGLISSLQKGEGLQRLLESSVRAVRHLVGYDRVMAYRFLPNGDGEVVAEAAGVGIESYNGLRYPASDIPTQVRQIMLRSPFRLIHDIHADHVALVQAPDSPPLDMTFSQLRGVSPIHIEYLANMGVRATMNVSIIVHGRLWGLFAFHHYRPRQLTPDERSMCELFGQLTSMLVQQEIEQTRLSRIQEANSVLSAIKTRGLGLEQTIDTLSTDLRTLVGADGLVLWDVEGAKKYGDVPSNEVLEVLKSMPMDPLASVQSLLSVPALADIADGLGKSAGVLMLQLTDTQQVMFFRNEVAQSIRWAGGKEKQIEYGPHGPRLTPRASFAEYCESVSGQCTPWMESDVSLATQIGQELTRRIHDGSAIRLAEQQKEMRYRDLLIAELNHRVRNTLALVRSIARQTKAKSESLEVYVESLERRLAALSVAHDLIGGSGLQWARIDNLVQTELKPYVEAGNAVDVGGPLLAVRADIAPIMALLFHEMTTNSVKYGVLSGRSGSLSVTWLDHSGGVEIHWLESMQEEVAEPQHRGFGLTLIERAIPFQCNGRSSIEFDARRLSIKFWLPEEAVERVSDGLPTPTRKQQYSSVPSDYALRLDAIHTALVLEDNIVLAMEMERMLRALGVDSVDSVSNAELATAAIERVQYDAALLDINLNDAQNGFEIAKRLLESGVRVVFVSGYDSSYEMPLELKGVVRLVKPISRVDLVNAFQAEPADDEQE